MNNWKVITITVILFILFMASWLWWIGNAGMEENGNMDLLRAIMQ